MSGSPPALQSFGHVASSLVVPDFCVYPVAKPSSLNTSEALGFLPLKASSSTYLMRLLSHMASLSRTNFLPCNFFPPSHGHPLALTLGDPAQKPFPWESWPLPEHCGLLSWPSHYSLSAGPPLQLSVCCWQVPLYH